MRFDLTAGLIEGRRKMIAATLFALWIASLALPAITLYDGHNQQPLLGAYVLGMGWIAMMRFQFGWLANIMLLVSLWLLIRPRPHIAALRIVAGMLAMFALHSLDLFVHPEEHGMRGAHAGYFLWLGVCLAAAMIATVFSFQTIAERHDQPV
ncbi:hypothetical protein [Sphingomonas sp. G-3-2-10]|uniref:hypothetical protein n=1 Tax=Sphingomonas sp. G-3-2-10 TaxID=2728838 RepID=UPI00146AE990|nr:hypothetical protein [Sphingomonas sp. G-3-2-10]NML06482.1 hypothetical protein [Sphingomonas sp. G-3-2-10]